MKNKVIPTGMSSVNQEELDGINKPQESASNKENLEQMGGVPGLIERLHLDPAHGLTKAQHTEHIQRYGINKLPEKPMKGFWELWIESFNDLTLIILITAAVVSLGVGSYEDPSKGWIEGLAILIAVLIVAFVTAGNDYSKELQFRALEESSKKDERTIVMRDGQRVILNPEELTVGDVIILQAGGGIPADSILLEDNVTIASNESSLTGEPEPQRKSWQTDPFLLSSCTICEADQNVRAMVIAVGASSQWGKIREKLVQEPENTPLQDKLDDMVQLIGWIGTGAAVATFIALMISHGVREKGADWLGATIHAFIIAVTIIVVAIPEGLPLAVTIALAYSTRKMYEDQNLIRVLAACETMGNATNICSDKTGTLTQNQMRVVEAWFHGERFTGLEQEGCSSLANHTSALENCCVNRTTILIYKDEFGEEYHRPRVEGNATEGALILLAKGAGCVEDEDAYRDQIFFPEDGDKVFAFNSSKKRSSAVMHYPATGGYRVYVKGAPDWVLEDCTHMSLPDGSEVPFTSEDRTMVDDVILDMANNALRTLCLAHRDFDELPPDWETNPPDTEGLVVDGIVGIIDPLRDDVTEAVQIAQEAGVTVRMVTGDNIHTAKAIAKQCGILKEGGLAMEGPVFRTLTPIQLDSILPRLQVLARSSPDDKYLLVTRLNGHGMPSDQASWEKFHAERIKRDPSITFATHKDILLPGMLEDWKKTRPDGGQVVGVTGDGTNDAPALKAGDVGLSMGITGTQVAQDASDIVILDDRFSSIVHAIKWGRSVYDNITKFLQFQLTVNVVALLLVFIGAVAGFDAPLNAVMMLWVNLIMDTMGALALATEPPTESLLQRKPFKRTAPLVSHPMWRNIFAQSILQLIILLLLLFKGAQWFDVHEGNYCTKWEWGSFSSTKIADHGVTCDALKTACPSGSSSCMEANFPVESEEVGLNCADLCEEYDYTHFTIIFNAFVFCQVFNEFNARSVGDKWDVFSDVRSNPIFLAVIVVTFLTQLFVVEVGGDFTRTAGLSASQWLITIGLGAIALPVGVLMRFIPIKPDPNTFADTSQITNDSFGNMDIESVVGNAGGIFELQERQEEKNLI
jgi:calcium-translocating P-type ATPase